MSKTVDLTLDVSLQTVAHHQNRDRLILFCRYYFGRWRCLDELAELVPLRHSCGRSTHSSKLLHDFYFTILDFTRFSMSTVISFRLSFSASFVPKLASATLSARCFLLTYVLNGFKSRVNIHLISVNAS